MVQKTALESKILRIFERVRAINIEEIMRVIFKLAILALVLSTSAISSPRLVVVISLDQFRFDYLTRFRAHFGQGGFAYLLERGASFNAASFKHSLNMTGPGHAVILSGSYANQNGIVANAWYDRERRKELYCVRDEQVSLVGAQGEPSSPANFIGSTLGDELRMVSGYRSKVVSISNKDRAAVLMGGKLATGVFWMVDSLFVTSSYYAPALPAWVDAFNRSGKVTGYFGAVWRKALPESAYAGLDRDDAPYESSVAGMGRVFPHPIRGDDSTRITRSYYGALLSSPFGSEVLAELAKSAVRGEKLGKRGATDLLAIGFSCNDYVGHAFGPHSHEALDMTVRTDRILADLFRFLDREVGLGRCLIVLTSDHGVCPIPEYILTTMKGVEAGRIPASVILGSAEQALTSAYGPPREGKWIEGFTNNNLYINPDAVRLTGAETDRAARIVADTLRRRREIAEAATWNDMRLSPATNPLLERMRRSFHPLRSGDVFYALKPYFLEAYGPNPTGTSHGEPYGYDAHVPVVIMGKGVKPGTYAREASPCDIAPTLAVLLGVALPPGGEGRVLHECLR